MKLYKALNAVHLFAKTSFAVAMLASIAHTASAGDCSSVDSYTDGVAYSKGQIVQHVDSTYSCKVDGWCSQGGPYSPGEGWAWAEAWQHVKDCSQDDVAVNTEGEPEVAAAPAFPITKAQFNQLFPNRIPFYSYTSFREAAKRFPKFARTGDLATRKREVAAALANFQHETGNFRYAREINRGVYCGDWGSCSCAPGRKYYGRGPIQLSWQGNYCAAGAALGLDLRNNPDLVAKNAKVAWQTAIWFWMTQKGAGNMTAHQAIVNKRGFGQTIRTINGALECNGGHPDQVTSRIQKYKRIAKKLGVKPGANLRC